MENNDVNDNDTSNEVEQKTNSLSKGLELSFVKENLAESPEEGEEIVVEYNHNDYTDLLGPLWTPLAKSVQTPSSASVLKKPGHMPPFALFIQEQRPQMQQDNPDISFGEVGKQLGEKWQTLKQEEKEKYQLKAKQITDARLKSWMENIRSLPLESQMSSLVSNVRPRGSGRGGVRGGVRGVGRGGGRGGQINVSYGQRQRGRGGRGSQTGGQTGPIISSVSSLNTNNINYNLPEGTSITKTTRQSAVRLAGLQGLPGLSSAISVSRVQPEVVVLSHSGPRAPPGTATLRGGSATPVRSVLKRRAGQLSSPMAFKRERSTPRMTQGCRVCGEETSHYFSLQEKSEVVRQLKDFLNISLDLQAEKEVGCFPTVVCIKCSNILESFNYFSKSVSRGQEMIQSKVEAARLQKLQREKFVPVTESHDTIEVEAPDSILPDSIAPQGSNDEKIETTSKITDQSQDILSIKEEQDQKRPSTFIVCDNVQNIGDIKGEIEKVGVIKNP